MAFHVFVEPRGNSRMQGSDAQSALAADTRIGCGIVGMWRWGKYDECEPTGKYSSFCCHDRAEPYGRFVAQSDGTCARSIRNAGVEFDQYHRMYGLRGLERIGGNDRLALDGTTPRNSQVCVDVHRRGR
jgi:hypothetical protein